MGSKRKWCDQRKKIKRHRLMMWWDQREKTLKANIEPRTSNAPLYFIFNVFNDDVVKELKERGYDLNTIRLQIDRSKSYVRQYRKDKCQGNPTQSL